MKIYANRNQGRAHIKLTDEYIRISHLFTIHFRTVLYQTYYPADLHHLLPLSLHLGQVTAQSKEKSRTFTKHSIQIKIHEQLRTDGKRPGENWKVGVDGLCLRPGRRCVQTMPHLSGFKPAGITAEHVV